MLRHCGLDPQSHNSEDATTMRFRVEYGMTECACHCEGVKRPSQSRNNAPQAVKNILTYSLNNLFTSKRVAFTLAEVLITLAIIGIVAVMTLPTLISNYQQKSLDNHFKKSYALINQALLTAQSKYDYLPDCYYSVNIGNYKNRDCVVFWNDFFGSLRVVKKCENHAYAQGCIPEYEGYDTVAEANNPDAEVPEGYESFGEYASKGCSYFRKSEIMNNKTVYILSGGTIIFHYYQSIPIIAVDINGKQGPNKWGYDLFSFMIMSDGNKFRFDSSGCMLPDQGGVLTETKIYQLFGG